MKNTTLICALTLLTALAAAGCDSSGMQTIQGDVTDTITEDAFDVGTAEAGVPAIDDEAIAPTDPQTDDPVAPTPPDDNGVDDPFCPAGTLAQGNPYHCCRIDDPQVCFIVDPGPGDNDDGRPGLNRPLENAVVYEDPSEPPPDSGGSGGGGYNDSRDLGCHFQGPTGDGRRRRVDDTTGPDADALDVNDCFIL